MNLQEAIHLLENNNYLVETDVNSPIRECTREEVKKAACYAHYYMFAEQHKDIDPSDEFAILHEFAASAEPYLGIYDGDELLHAYTIDGKQCFLLSKPIFNRKENYLALAYVNPEARGTGLAARLLQKCIDVSPNGIILTTSKYNIAMNKLAQKLGFKPLNKDGSYYISYRYKKKKT
jgi:GNAT superfamily N-acetyltransferase